MSDMDSRSSCSSDSVAASDLSESAADLETMNHGIFEAQAAMATQAGRMSQFAGGDTTAIHLAHVADMLPECTMFVSTDALSRARTSFCASPSSR